jgi:hypothetical protein
VKKFIIALSIVGFLSSSGYAGYTKPTCVPEYIKQDGPGFVSLMIFPPLVMLNIMAVVSDGTENRGHDLRRMKCTTVAVALHSTTTPLDIVPSLRK